MRLITSLGLAIISTGLPACAHPRTLALGYNISSDQSDYSPTVRLAIALAPLLSRMDSIVVIIDSGSVSAPGVQVSDAPAGMSGLYIAALVTRPTNSEERDPSVRPWSVIEQSDSLPIADSLRLGERRILRAMRFSLPRPAAFDPRESYLTFRITGQATTRDVRLADGRLIPGRPGRIRVFACAAWTLDGFVKTRRSRALASAYGTVC